MQRRIKKERYEIRKFKVDYPGKHIQVEETTSKNEWSEDFKKSFNSFLMEVYKWYDFTESKGVWSGLAFADCKGGFFCSINSRLEHFPGENRFVRELIENTPLKGIMIIPDKNQQLFRYFDGNDSTARFGPMKLILPPTIHKFINPADYMDEILIRTKTSTEDRSDTLVIQNSFHALEAILLKTQYEKIFILENSPVFKYSIDRNLKANGASDIIVFKGTYTKFNELSGIKKYDLLLNNFKKGRDIRKIDLKRTGRVYRFGFEEGEK